jgi:hypothetical protein
MTDLLLSSSMFINQLLTMGLPAIDDSLMRLLTAMETFPKSAVLGSAISFAKMLGCLLALCMGSYECWMMMLGRRGMDVMKLARIIGLSLCITYSSYICESLKMPGKGLEEVTRQMAQSKNKEVAALELKVAQKQDDYLKRLRQVQDSIETAKQVQEIGEDAHWWDKLIYNMENLGSTINNYAQRAAVAAETKVSEWINDVIRFVGELIFQMSYYGMLVAQRIFMTILATFAPIMFALSIVPPWSNAWAQWMGKYLSLSLWGFVVYFCLYYIDFILMYNLMEDIKAYDTLLARHGQLMAADRRVGLAGHRLQLYVRHGHARGCLRPPLRARSSLMAHPRRYQLQRRNRFRQYGTDPRLRWRKLCYGCCNDHCSRRSGRATGTASIIGAAQQSHSDGGSGFNQTARTIMAQTGLGTSYSRGADSARSINNVGKSDSNYRPGGAEGS